MTRTKTEGAVLSRTVVRLGFLLVTLMAVGLMLVAKPAHAQATFTVTNTTDANNVCDSGCSLREAITTANNTPGADTINFNIPESVVPGIKTIRPTTQLPIIREQVTIDGYSQPDSSANTLAEGTNAKIMVELDGSSAGSANGLVIAADDVVVRGLAIGGFRLNGIVFDNILGNDPSDVRVEGNFIGTDASGTVARPNTFNGLALTDSGGNNTIGGTEVKARNLISGNGDTGVRIVNFEEGGFVIAGNLIGTQRDGKSRMGNRNDGVTISGSGGNTVGGATAGTANTIAFNGDEGVEIRGDDASGNRILSNSVFSNGELGIDLSGDVLSIDGDGPTPNDPGDADAGPNGLQNKPAIASATNSGTKTTIKGSLRSKPNQNFVVRFFSNPSGTNEGKTFIGQKALKTDSEGKVSFAFSPAQKVGAGKTVTATATGSEGTSEFCAPRTVVAG